MMAGPTASFKELYATYEALLNGEFCGRNRSLFTC
jgi:hypothetical protein